VRALALYRRLIDLRRSYEALAGSDALDGEATAPDDETLVMRRANERDTFWVIARFKRGGDVDLTAAAAAMDIDLRGSRFEVVLDTEHAEFAADPRAIDVSPMPARIIIRFARPGAIILRS
jgi:Domain of unknown function (DUF3459)